MARTPNDTANDGGRPSTLAETLFYFSDPKLRRELEEFRVEFEALHGTTDLTKRYTSTWPKVQRDWLREHQPKHYFDGLPLFVKAFIKAKLQVAARNGNLDDVPTYLQRLYVSGNMDISSEGRGR
jgi:hypothetical protein